MNKIARQIVRFRVPILIISFILLIPAAVGYFGTRINYDILYYLPDDIETMEGQDILLDEFGKGAYALVIVEGMTDAQVSSLKGELEEVEHVDSILWFDSIADSSIPQEILPDSYYEMFHNGDATLMAMFFDTSTSDEKTMDAIEEIRAIAGEQCFLSSMSAIVTDTRDLVNEELPMYVLVAVLLSCLVLALTMNSWLIPVLFMLNIGMAIIYNLGTNIIQGEISFITMALAAVLQLGVTMDYSIFLWNSYQEQRGICDNKEDGMVNAITMTISSVTGSSLTTIAGFVALCFMTFTLGLDLGVVMAKGVFLGVISCVTILPALILISDKALQKTAHRPVTLNAEKISCWIIRHNRPIAVTLLLLWILAIYGYQHMNVYYNLDSSLPDYLPSIQANTELSAHFDMSTVHLVLADSNLSGKDAHIMLQEMNDVDGVQFALGMDALIGYQIPKEFLPDELTEILESDDWQLMLISSEYAVASDEVNAQVEELAAILKKYDSTGMLIGEAPCTKDLIEITDKDFRTVSMVSIGAIFIIILLVLRSVSLPVLLVIIIELAIYINMSLAYFTGTTLPFIASIVIGTIQLGSTVDYAILMTNRYQRERKAGLDKKEAASISLSSSMPSIITSALGFFAATIGVGIYSDVDLIGSLCMLMARGAIISMFVVLLLLPSVFLLCDGLIQKTSWNKR
ncbi:MAG: MMPL family transporter [Clostridiales bacterium]|nr:MMPL family transporter [Clostridiales bacterium]